MTREELDSWKLDYENEELSGGAFILYLLLYIAEQESLLEKSGTIENTICNCKTKFKDPKFKHGDAWYAISENNKLQSGKIYGIRIVTDINNDNKIYTQQVFYQTNYYHWCIADELEEDLFTSKRDALQSIVDKANEN